MYANLDYPSFQRFRSTRVIWYICPQTSANRQDLDLGSASRTRPFDQFHRARKRAHHRRRGDAAAGRAFRTNCRRRSDSRSQPFCSSTSASRPLMRSWAAARAMAASAGAARGAAVRRERNSSRTAASICSSPVGSLLAGSRPEDTPRETVEGRTEALDAASTALRRGRPGVKRQEL